MPIVYFACGLLLTLASSVVKSEEVSQGQICWPNPDNCQAFSDRTIAHGFPLKYKEGTDSSLALTRPEFYWHRFVLDIFFWAFTVAGIHYIAQSKRSK